MSSLCTIFYVQVIMEIDFLHASSMEGDAKQSMLCDGFETQKAYYFLLKCSDFGFFFLAQRKHNHWPWINDGDINF